MMEREAQFTRAVMDGVQKSMRELDYTPTRFLEMVGEMGAVLTAKQLVNSPTVSEGYTRLWEERRLELTVEYEVLQPRFRPLFSDAERAKARTRLDAYGFDWTARPIP